MTTRPPIHSLVLYNSYPYVVASYRMDPNFVCLTTFSDSEDTLYEWETVHIQHITFTPHTVPSLFSEYIYTAADLLSHYPELFI